MRNAMKLKGEIKKIDSLSYTEKDRMFYLMKCQYDNFKKDKFMYDLNEKDGVLLLYDKRRSIQGFTTYLLIETIFDNKKIYALYSGDTIVKKRYCGQIELFKNFGELLSKFLKEKKEPLYWFLITKGIKTYLILPLFFKQFYPNYFTNTPLYEKRLMVHLVSLKFGKFYIKEKNIVRIYPPADRLKKEFAYESYARLENPHVKFFLEKNPGYINGDELACIAKIEISNFTKAALKFIKIQ